MAEAYFYSSLTGQQIEDTLVGAVRFNADQELTTSQKQRARDNIGAGALNTGFAIIGYCDTVEDLPTFPIPQAGDAYGVGTEPPYEIYVWDAINSEWVDNGTLSVDVVIDDTETTDHTTWSSDKIDTELGTLGNAKQDKIAAVGMLKGSGTAVQAATLGTDYTAVDDTLTTSTIKTWSVDKQKSTFSNVLLVERVPLGTYAVAANDYHDWTKDVSKTGYTPLGIVGFTTSTSYAAVGICYLSDATTIYFRVRNMRNSTSETSPAVDILYVKN